MSNLSQAISALNSVYGNTLLIENRGYDEYYCPECKERHYEDQYNHKQGICFKCFYKEGNI